MIHEDLRSQILNGALNDCGSYLRGNYRGYYIIVEPLSGRYLIRIHANSQNDAENAQLSAWLKPHMAGKGNVDCVQKNFVELSVNLPDTSEHIPNVLNEAIAPVIDYLAAGSYQSGCECCGSSAQTPECYNVNGMHHFMCSNCPDNLKKMYLNSQKSSFAPGLFGAFVGSLIGVALWILIYRLGYIAGIAGAVTGICAMKGYEKLGKHLDLKGIIGSVVIMCVMVFLAAKISWTWDIFDALNDSGFEVSFVSVFFHFGETLKLFEATGEFVGELVLGYGLTALCSVGYIIQAVRAGSAGKNWNISKEM